MTASLATATTPPGPPPETAEERATRERRTRELHQFLEDIDAIIRKRCQLSPQERSNATALLQVRYEQARSVIEALQASLDRQAIHTRHALDQQHAHPGLTAGVAFLTACMLARRYE